MAETVVLKVAMSCGGCSGAVKRVLDKTQGVEWYDIDMEQQKVTVKTSLAPDVVLQAVAKTGKRLSFGKKRHLLNPNQKLLKLLLQPLEGPKL